MSLNSEESKEVEDLLNKQKEKEVLKIRPLPGISDFSCCRSETIKKLEEQKRVLEIYKEIRGLRRKFRGEIVDIKKKNFQNKETRKSETEKKLEVEKEGSN